MNPYSWPAPAKLNLFLHITGRRADGYHELQTIFQFVELGDSLYFDIRDEHTIRRITPLPGIAQEQDLVVRAARLLQQQTGCNKGVDIRICKRLPMGGGMGGGSSDAATTLVALNQLWDTQLSAQALAEMGLSLGADVPIFMYGQSAWAEGVGEHLSPVELPEPWFVIINPGVHVSTAEIFSHSQLTRDRSPSTIRAFLTGQCQNVCEPLVRKLYPEVDKALQWLAERGPARMTGTGATIFASYASKEAAEQVAEQVPGEWQTFVTRARNRSPLLERMQEAPYQ